MKRTANRTSILMIPLASTGPKKGSGPKKVPVLGEDGEPLRVATPERRTARSSTSSGPATRKLMKAWKIAWAETANRHLVCRHEIRLDGRSYAERVSMDCAKASRTGKAALARKARRDVFCAGRSRPAQEMADRVLTSRRFFQAAWQRTLHLRRERILPGAAPLCGRSRRLHQYPGALIASDELVMLSPQQLDAETGKASEPRVFTTRRSCVSNMPWQSPPECCQSAGASPSPARRSPQLSEDRNG